MGRRMGQGYFSLNQGTFIWVSGKMINLVGKVSLPMLAQNVTRVSLSWGWSMARALTTTSMGTSSRVTGSAIRSMAMGSLMAARPSIKDNGEMESRMEKESPNLTILPSTKASSITENPMAGASSLTNCSVMKALFAKEVSTEKGWYFTSPGRHSKATCNRTAFEREYTNTQMATSTSVSSKRTRNQGKANINLRTETITKVVLRKEKEQDSEEWISSIGILTKGIGKLGWNMEKAGTYGEMESYMRGVFGWTRGRVRAKFNIQLTVGMKGIGGMIREKGRECFIKVILQCEF